MEGLGIAQKEALGERVLSTFHDHVAHTILQLRQQRACHQFLLVCIQLLYTGAATFLPKRHTQTCSTYPVRRCSSIHQLHGSNQYDVVQCEAGIFALYNTTAICSAYYVCTSRPRTAACAAALAHVYMGHRVLPLLLHLHMYKRVTQCCLCCCSPMAGGWTSAGRRHSSMLSRLWRQASAASPMRLPWKPAPSPPLGTSPLPCASSMSPSHGTTPTCCLACC